MNSAGEVAQATSILDDRRDDRGRLRLAVLSDTHLSPAGTPDGVWNNTTRRSATAQLLQAALDEIVEAGHSTVLVLGDIADDGTPEMISRALTAFADAGLTAWVVPGNHDTALRPDGVELAAGPFATCTVLTRRAQRPAPGWTLVGVGLQSSDGGQTCSAVDLPDVRDYTDDLLIWTGHYPLLSMQPRLRAAGLRYPGDLLNLTHTLAAALRFTGPILVLHGHLHTAVTRHTGRILQLGCPAVVEWPHAWIDLTVELDAGGIRVEAITRPIAGDWSRRRHNTQLCDPQQAWLFADGLWRRASRRGPDHGQLRGGASG